MGVSLFERLAIGSPLVSTKGKRDGEADSDVSPLDGRGVDEMAARWGIASVDPLRGISSAAYGATLESSGGTTKWSSIWRL